METLAMTGAATIVAAMATDVWTTARDSLVEFFRHHSPDRLTDIETQLQANAALITRAGDAERARGALIGSWQLELEDLLIGHPAAAEELGMVTARIQAALPPMRQQWVQNISARDRAVVNAVQHGDSHTYYMDSPGSRPPAGLASDDSQG